MQLRYHYRIYPTPSQQKALARAFGCARVVFNDGLRARREARREAGIRSGAARRSARSAEGISAR
ncbi:helix-turn-helix domain-containing protein [Micromonospora sp. SL4-19]|uniref:helix-turn-helix domain-containing protein n=1 Tax=Micromonospora sp. SL4-19 TaxID=3399129 RepID=UPI003A4D8971